MTHRKTLLAQNSLENVREGRKKFCPVLSSVYLVNALRKKLLSAVPITVFASAALAAQNETLTPEPTIFFPMAHIFTFLFLMLGPKNVLGPFAKLTQGADRALEKKIAYNAVIFSGIALLVAGLLGEIILKKYGVPPPVLALAAGAILFLVAIQGIVRQFSFSGQEPATQSEAKPSMKVALDPLAFPVIATPYGIAALIVFLSFAPNLESKFQIGLIVVVVMTLNLLAMLFARKLLATMGIALAILGAVLGVVQVALGLQIIHNSLRALNIL